MLTDPTPSKTGHLSDALAEMRASIAAEGTQKGLAGVLAAAILRLLEGLVALLTEFRAGTLPTAPERGAGADARADGSGDDGAEGEVATIKNRVPASAGMKIKNWVLAFAGMATKKAGAALVAPALAASAGAAVTVKDWVPASAGMTTKDGGAAQPALVGAMGGHDPRPLVAASAPDRSGDAGAEGADAKEANRVPGFGDAIEARGAARGSPEPGTRLDPGFRRGGGYPVVTSEHCVMPSDISMVHARPRGFVLLPNLKDHFRGGCLGLP